MSFHVEGSAGAGLNDAIDRIEQLEAEHAELYKENERFKVEVECLRKDKERLAWLQSKVSPAFVVGIGSTQNDENEYWYQVIANDSSAETVYSKAAPTIGEAIDNAMKGTP